MRIILFFDLPTITSSDINVYNKFRKYLIKNGYVMMQYSIYTKIVLNKSAVDTQIKRIIKEVPKKGMVQILVVTEKQFAGMINLSGVRKTDIQNDDERVVVL